VISVTPELRAAINAAENSPVDLYELYLDGATEYFADQAISWGGNDYTATVVSRSAVRRHEGGEIDRVTVTFTNVNRSMAQLLLGGEIEGRKLIVRKVDRSVADDSIVLFNGVMERASRINEQECVVEAVQLLGSIDHEVPARLFSVWCPWEFKGVECGYEGSGETCDKSWSNCAYLVNTHRFGGFRFVPHSGTYQYKEAQGRSWLKLWRRKWKTITATYEAVDDTPYDLPVPLIYGRVQIAALVIQHTDTGTATRVLAAFCAGPVDEMFHIRANEVAVADWTPHIGGFGEAGGGGSQTVDPRFPQSYPYSLLAYVGLTVPSEVSAVDPAPNIVGIVKGRLVSQYAPDLAHTYEWSDNPIWVTRDFMTLPLAQGGMGIPDALMDDEHHALEALYCDEIITDPANDQKIYNPTSVPEDLSYKRYRSTSVDGQDPTIDGPYDEYEPGVDDDTSREPVPVSVKRFTLNVAIARSERAIDVLYKKLLPAFRGYITFSKEGKIQIRVERPATHTLATEQAEVGGWQIACAAPTKFEAGDAVIASPLTDDAELLTVYEVLEDRLTFTTQLTHPHPVGSELLKVAMVFDDSNIVGNLEYPLSDRQPSTNRVTIKYVDAPAGFEARELRINDYEHQAKVHRVNNEDVDGSGIDSYFQAWRIGQFRRSKLRDLGKFISLTADIKASVLEIGDIVAVNATEVGLYAVPFRMIELAFEPNDEVTIVGQVYSTGIYSDTAPQTTVSVPAVFTESGGGGSQMVQVAYYA
jgi:phage-related protein